MRTDELCKAIKVPSFYEVYTDAEEELQQIVHLYFLNNPQWQDKITPERIKKIKKEIHNKGEYSQYFYKKPPIRKAYENVLPFPTAVISYEEKIIKEETDKESSRKIRLKTKKIFKLYYDKTVSKRRKRLTITQRKRLKAAYRIIHSIISGEPIKTDNYHLKKQIFKFMFILYREGNHEFLEE